MTNDKIKNKCKNTLKGVYKDKKFTVDVENDDEIFTIFVKSDDGENNNYRDFLTSIEKTYDVIFVSKSGGSDFSNITIKCKEKETT